MNSRVTDQAIVVADVLAKAPGHDLDDVPGNWVKNTKIVCSTLLLVALSACGTMPQWAGPNDRDRRAERSTERYADIEVIAADLVNALMQIDGKHPVNTVIRMEPPVSTFGTALKAVLESAGYGLRIGSGDSFGDSLQYSVTPQAVESSGRHYTYFISVGEVKMKRDYFVQAQGVTPSSNLFVIGTDPSLIQLNDSIFEAPPAGAPAVKPPPPVEIASTESVTISPVSPKEKAVKIETVSVDNDPGPVEKIANPDVAQSGVAQSDVAQSEVERIEVAVTADRTQSTTSPPEGSRSPDKKRRNMYKLGESNYAGLLADYTDEYQEILIFANDSRRLGEVNKNKVRAMADRMTSHSHVVSVIGCSHGRTSLENGNAVLATGRAQRVKEAFMIAGIAEDRIFEEGCWAPNHFDEMMPRRGVVVTIKRQA